LLSVRGLPSGLASRRRPVEGLMRRRAGSRVRIAPGWLLGLPGPGQPAGRGPGAARHSSRAWSVILWRACSRW
jgi:hypothetical protein